MEECSSTEEYWNLHYKVFFDNKNFKLDSEIFKMFFKSQEIATIQQASLFFIMLTLGIWSGALWIILIIDYN